MALKTGGYNRDYMRAPVIENMNILYRHYLSSNDITMIRKKIYITKVHANFDGDTFFPHLKNEEWKLTDCQKFEPDEKNLFSYSYLEYDRIL